MKSIFLFCLFPLVTFAEGVQMMAPTLVGLGCPDGSYGVTLSPDASKIQLLTDDFQIQTDPGSNQWVAFKSCSVAVPVKIPMGTQVRWRVRLSGFAQLKERSLLFARLSAFSAGQARRPTSRRWNFPASENFVLDDAVLSVKDNLWTPCGQQEAVMRLNFSLAAQGQVMAQIDQADLSLEARYCSSQEGH